MRLYTSNFKKHGSHAHAVAISIGVPKGWNGKQYLPLAPTRAMLKMSPEEYWPRYEEILARLDPFAVVRDLQIMVFGSATPLEMPARVLAP